MLYRILYNTGYIVNQGDIEHIANRIKRLDDDRALLEIMGLRGKVKILKNNLNENAFFKYSNELL